MTDLKGDRSFVSFGISSKLLISLFDSCVELRFLMSSSFQQRDVVLFRLTRNCQIVSTMRGRESGRTFSLFFRTVLISPFLIMSRFFAALMSASSFS